MTKRFTIEESENQDTIFDNEGPDDYYHLGNDTRDVKGICDLLNDQDETIKRQAKRIELLESLIPKELIEE